MEKIASTEPATKQEEDKHVYFCNTFFGTQAGNLDRIAQATSFTSNRIDVMGKEERSAADDPEDSALTQARRLAAADSITRAGEEGKLHSTMAEAFGLAPRLRRPALLLNESLRMPGQVVGEVSTIHRVDDLGNPFTMTYPSDLGAMSNKHGKNQNSMKEKFEESA